MALMTTEERRQVWALWQQQNGQPVPITKTQLRNAVDAIDQWFEDNLAALNAAIPAGARNGLTQKQKVMLMLLVVNKRFEVS